jgi:hypothetical protein
MDQMQTVAKKREPTEREQRKAWAWFATLSDEEQLDAIKQAMDMLVEEKPATFLKLPNGNYTTWPKKASS